jgi:predicted lipid-binding transport protein (Tim44 family)
MRVLTKQGSAPMLVETVSTVTSSMSGSLARLVRAVSASLIALALVALAPAGALAAAGGGSSGFGGGGGGGGGGGFSGGGGGYSGGGGGHISTGEAIVIGVLVVIVVVAAILYWIYRTIVNAFVRERLRRRRADRVRKVELASAEAAVDDPDFAHDAVCASCEQLFRDVQWAWDAVDRGRLRQLVGGDLLVEWERRLDDFERKNWRNHVQVVGDVDVQYLGLVNRTDDADDRVVVRIDARLRDYVVNKHGGYRITHEGTDSEFVRLQEYWTLGKRTDGGWMVLSIEQDSEGAHHLDSDIVASPWGDDKRLRDEALVEGAVAEKVLDGYKVSDVADLDFDGDARTAALDLSLADGRFAPDVLEAAVRAAVGAWTEAVDGEDAGLLALATEAAAHDLLYPGGGAGEQRRLVVRGPRIKALRIVALDAAAEPPTMTVEVDVRGRRYVQDRDTAAIISGDDKKERDFTEHWLMGLSDDDRNPWRIVDATAGGRAAGARS